MKVFIDTNVFLDYIQQRPEGWKEAETIFFLAIHGDIELLVTDLTVANMRYITRKNTFLPVITTESDFFPGKMETGSFMAASRHGSGPLPSSTALSAFLCPQKGNIRRVGLHSGDADLRHLADGHP